MIQKRGVSSKGSFVKKSKIWSLTGRVMSQVDLFLAALARELFYLVVTAHEANQSRERRFGSRCPRWRHRLRMGLNPANQCPLSRLGEPNCVLALRFIGMMKDLASCRLPSRMAACV